MLTLRNTGRVAGRLLGVSGGALNWQHPDVAGAVRLRLDAIQSLVLPADRRVVAGDSPRWLVSLADGGFLSGTELRMTGEVFELTSRSAGRLRIHRQQVTSVWQNLGEQGKRFNELVSFGTAQCLRPILMDGSIVVTNVRPGPLYRNVPLPDPLLAEVDLPRELPGPVSLRFGVAEVLDERPGAHLMVSLSNRQLSIQVLGRASKGLRPADFAVSNLTGRVTRLAVAMNRKDGHVMVYLNGRYAGQADFGQTLARADRGISWEIPSGTLLPAPNLRLSPAPDNLVLPATASDRDTLRLINHDFLAGTLAEVSSNTVVFLSSIGRTEFPLDRVASVELATTNSPPAEVTTCEFLNGDRLTGKVEQLDAGGITVAGASWGTATVPREQLLAVHFHPSATNTILQLRRDTPPDSIRGLMLLRRKLIGRGINYSPGGLTLARRERWPGTLAGIRDGLVYWQCPDTIEPIAFRQSTVEIVCLPADVLPVSLPQGKAAVELVNGDLLTGDLGEMDGEKLALRPWGMRPLEIPRRHIATIRPHHPDPQALDVGPSDLWSRTPPATEPNRQKYEGGLYLRRQLKLPDRLCLEWHSTWNDPDINLGIAVFLKGAPFANEGNEYFLAHFSTSFAGIIPFPNPPQPVVQPTPAEQATQEELNKRRAFILLAAAAAGHGHFALYADRQTGEAYLFCNDQLIAERRHPASHPSGDGVLFTSRGPNPVKVSHVVLREWRGTKADLPTRPPTNKQDCVQHTDAAWLCGAVQGIRADAVHMTGKTVPLAQVTQIAFPAVAAPRYRPGDVKVVLHNGDMVTLALEGSDAQRLTGNHPLLGSMTVLPSAVSLVDFMPDQDILTNLPFGGVTGQSSQAVH